MSRAYEITDEAGHTTKAYALRDAGRFAGHGVYELLNQDFEVIYIGRTRNLAHRLRGHRATKPWFPSVLCFRWTPCADYAEAVALENMAIAASEGRFNERGFVDHLDIPGTMNLPAAVEDRLRKLYALSESDRALADSFMLALRDAGWTLQSIATPLGITRERVRQRAATAARDYDILVPAAPSVKRWIKPRPTLGPVELRRIAELQPLATKCRGLHGPNHPNRLASEQLTDLLAAAAMRGVARKQLADAMGVSVKAVHMRLKAHGYHKVAPSMTPFGTPHPSRQGQHQAECFRGHAMTGSNVRFINGDADRPVCRACERVRQDAYRARAEGGEAA